LVLEARWHSLVRDSVPLSHFSESVPRIRQILTGDATTVFGNRRLNETGGQPCGRGNEQRSPESALARRFPCRYRGSHRVGRHLADSGNARELLDLGVRIAATLDDSKAHPVRVSGEESRGVLAHMHH
jgi:hypothetical protein